MDLWTILLIILGARMLGGTQPTPSAPGAAPSPLTDILSGLGLTSPTTTAISGAGGAIAGTVSSVLDFLGDIVSGIDISGEPEGGISAESIEGGLAGFFGETPPAEEDELGALLGDLGVSWGAWG